MAEAAAAWGDRDRQRRRAVEKEKQRELDGEAARDEAEDRRRRKEEGGRDLGLRGQPRARKGQGASPRNDWPETPPHLDRQFHQRLSIGQQKGLQGQGKQAAAPRRRTREDGQQKSDRR